ncbi:MAG: hypothetical protein Q4F17_02265 [Eubacteriales bacterium]|nr:hypothetical protein [Eubacteriales bacterium]
MSKWILAIAFIFSLAVPASAMEIQAPAVPDSGAALMPRETGSFADGLMELVRKGLGQLRPDLAEAARTGVTVIGAVMLVSVLRAASGQARKAAELAGAVTIVAVLMSHTNAMIALGAETVQELSSYGRLLFPVMTSALAAQGGLTASAALYAGTAAFDGILASLISKFLVPGVYAFLALAAANGVTGEELLKKLRDLVKTAISWCLKTLLTVFTTYMSITGVVSGTTDAAALKATKVTISSVVPVVGGILSDASEAVLVGAGLVKNAAGIYGILAVLAVFLEPFLKIGVQYLMWKLTAALCALFGSKPITGLIEDFSAAMGLLLGMTGAACLLLLISCICFMKGVG